MLQLEAASIAEETIYFLVLEMPWAILGAVRGRPRAERWGVVLERGRKNHSGSLKGGSVQPSLGSIPVSQLLLF